MITETDVELLRRYTEEESEAAFADLVRRRVNLVYSVALRQCGGDAHLAEDVTQKVFTDCALKAAMLARRTVLSGWLYRSAQFAASDVVRSERRRRAREEEVSTMPTMTNDPTAPADWDKVRPVLDEALSELADSDRDAVALRFFEGCSFAEIGAVLRLSEEAARKRVERAVDKLHGLLARRGITSTSAALALVLASQAVGEVPATLSTVIASTALAEAAVVTTATGVFATALTIMNTTKLAASAAVLIAVLALGTAGYQIRARQTAKASLAAANRNHATLVARLRDTQNRAAVAEERMAELKSRADATEVRAAAHASSNVSAAWDPKVQGKAFLERNPEVKQAYIAWLDSMAESTYGELWKTLGLAPAQIEQFKILQRSGWYFTRNITADKKQGRLTIADPVPKETSDPAYRAILGEEGFRRYRELASDFQGRSTNAARNEVKLIARGLVFTNSPLSPNQAEQLTQIIGDSLRTHPQKRDYDAIDAKAKSFLTPDQHAVWDLYSNVGRAHRAAVIARGSPAKK